MAERLNKIKLLEFIIKKKEISSKQLEKWIVENYNSEITKGNLHMIKSRLLAKRYIYENENGLYASNISLQELKVLAKINELHSL